jgi:hypothetical protein
MTSDQRPAGTSSPKSSPRRIAFSVLTFLLGAAALGGLFGIGLVIGWIDTDEGGIHRVHDLGFGVLYGILLSAAFFAMVRRPEAKPSMFLQVIAVGVAVAIASIVAAEPGYLAIAVIIIVAAAILLALHPARDGVLHPTTNASPLLSTFVLVGAVPLVWFGLSMARFQRDGSSIDPHVNMDHWVTMASMAFGLILVGVLASARIRGWRLTAWSAGLGTAVYGLASIVFVSYAGSEGTTWGLIALIGGLAFVVATEWEFRRSASSPSLEESR